MGKRLPPSSIHNHEHLSTTTLHFEHINLLQSLHTQYPILKMSENIQITLISNDGVAIKVDKAVAEKSMLIKNMMEDLGEGALNTDVPIPNVNDSVLKKVIEWCEHHKLDPVTATDDDSNSRDIKPLLAVGCKTVANMIKGKSPEEIRKTFNIQNDFTPEEEDQIRRENEWAEDR